jgi:hypothetical protein
MPLTDMAYFDGENLPRCTTTPAKADITVNGDLRRGQWECALPAGHGKFSDPRHRPHSWVMTGED